MRKFLFLTAMSVFVLSSYIYAQSTEDVIYLNNGGIWRGKILESVPGGYAKIETTDRNVIVVPDSTLKLICMNQPIAAKDQENKTSAVEMAASVSFFGGSTNSAGCSFITSYRFPFKLSVGAGIGNEWFEHQQIPFIFDVKYSFIKGSWSPYIYAHTGYAVPLSSKSTTNDYYSLKTDFYGGVLAGVGGGLRFNFSGHNALIFSMGFRYQQTKTVTSYPYNNQTEEIVFDKYNRLILSMGFLFN